MHPQFLKRHTVLQSDDGFTYLSRRLDRQPFVLNLGCLGIGGLEERLANLLLIP